MTTSYWLSEPPPPRPSVTVDDPDVVVVGAGVTGCAAALRLAQAGKRVRLVRRARGRRRARAAATAASRCAACRRLRRHGRSRSERRPRASSWPGRSARSTRSRALAGDAFRRVGSLRIAVDEEERDELRVEYEALVAAGFAAEWIEGFEPPLAGRFTAALRHVPGRRASARALGAAARGPRCRGGRRDPRAHARRVARRARRRHRRRLHRRLPERAPRPDRGAVIPTRGQVIATEPIPERFFEVPHYGRHGYDYWHQDEDGRIVAGGFRDVSLDSEFTADERLTEPVQHALHVVRQRPRRARAAGRLRLGGHLRHGDGLPPDRRPRPGPRRTSGSPAATPATATCSASRAASSWRRRSPVTMLRFSTSSIQLDS